MPFRLHQLWFVILFGFMLAGSGYAEPLSKSLVGIYLIEEQGNYREFIQVIYREGQFLLFENQGGEWSSPEEVEPVSKPEFENLLKQPVHYPFFGLANDTIALFQVPKGWQSGKFICNTGFWIMSNIGPIEVIKD